MRNQKIGWWLAFVILILVLHEAHELAHVLTGYALCNEWAARDFNAWLLRNCPSKLPQAMGPLFSYALMWIGVALLPRRTSLGLALLFAANPFARIFTAAMGGGDEKQVLGSRIAALIATLILCGIPIVLGWRAIRRIGPFLAMLLLPMIVTGVLLFVIGNGLLRRGVLAEPVIAGAPLFVHLVTIAATIALLFTMRHLDERP